MTARGTSHSGPARHATLDRRQLLTTLLAGLGSTLLVDSSRTTKAAQVAATEEEENSWHQVKAAFPFEPGYVALNAANLCPTSLPVLETQLRIMQEINRDPSFENRLRFEQARETTRARLAGMLGCDTDEIAITRNTSEGNATIIDGLRLGPGDEVVVWDQNHESNLLAWQVAAKRRGFSVVSVQTPAAPRDADELLAPFAAALRPHVRVLAFSHIANVSGIRLPAEALCELAHTRGVLSLVDGAQSFGMLALDLHDMGCDFYTGSAHKWLAGPRECGVLYVRTSAIGHVWPPMVTHGWSEARERTARRFDCLGQQDDARIVALASAVDFYEHIGRERVRDRILGLNAALRSGLAARVAGVELLTPTDAALSGGITSFTLPNPDAETVRRALYEARRISALAVPAGGRTLVRFCPHIYTLPDEIDCAIEALATAK